MSCLIEGCTREARRRGWCDPHYKRWWRYGDPTHIVRPYRQRRPAAERFWAQVDKTDGCWLWTGSLRNGYGWLTIDGAQRYAHRLVYEWTHGAIPAGLHIDHLCRDRRCVRPLHLEAVTQAENNVRAGRARREAAARVSA